jgi:type IV pilus assembly protein PilA
MFCPSCGKKNADQAKFCFSCGAWLSRSAPLDVTQLPTDPPPRIHRPGVVTLLAVLQFIGAGAWLVLGGVCLAVGLFGETAESGFIIVLGVILLASGIVQGICGTGLWKLKRYGRTIQLVLAVIGLVGFPVGTIISILIIVYLRKPGIRLLFSEKPPSELTREELSQIALASQSSGAVAVIVGVLVVVLGVAVVGIVAAIAVPGLLRARMAGNEASAIGALRAINSANLAYLTSCTKGAGYADSLATLGRPPAAGQPFLNSDLAVPGSLVKSGYAITYKANPTVKTTTCVTGVTTASLTFFVAAAPVTPGTSGTRYFATSEGQVIFQDTVPITAISRDGVPDPASATAIR